MQEQYYSVSEVHVNAVVIEGYYLPDPHTHCSEAEAGIILPFLDDPQTPAPASSNVMMFPDFSGRGFAVLNYPINTNVCIYNIISSLPNCVKHLFHNFHAV